MAKDKGDQSAQQETLLGHFIDLNLSQIPDLVQVSGDRVSHYENITFTTCRPMQDDWYLTANALELDHAEGLGTATGAKLLAHANARNKIPDMDRGLSAGDVDYINAHGTATRHGDEVEAGAIRDVFGDTVPVSSLKGYIGHTLGASGALETLITILALVVVAQRFTAPAALTKPFSRGA